MVRPAPTKSRRHPAAATPPPAAATPVRPGHRPAHRRAATGSGQPAARGACGPPQRRRLRRLRLRRPWLRPIRHARPVAGSTRRGGGSAPTAATSCYPAPQPPRHGAAGAGRRPRLPGLVGPQVRQPGPGRPPGVPAQPAGALPLAAGADRSRTGRRAGRRPGRRRAQPGRLRAWRATTTYAAPLVVVPVTAVAVEPPDATVPKSDPAALTDRTEAAWTMRWEPAAEGGSCGGAPGTGVIVLTIAPTRIRAISVQAGLLASRRSAAAAGPAAERWAWCWTAAPCQPLPL